MLQPLCRRTWAPRGQTPILKAWDRHDRLSAIAALTISPNRRRLGCYFHLQERNVHAPDVVWFVQMLHRTLGRPLILVCDRYSVHRKAVRLLNQAGHEWLQVEWLPAYAPELNPVEALWSHGKYARLPNFVAEDVDHLFDTVADTLDDLHFDLPLKKSFFQWAKLTL